MLARWNATDDVRDVQRLGDLGAGLAEAHKVGHLGLAAGQRRPCALHAGDTRPERPDDLMQVHPQRLELEALGAVAEGAAQAVERRLDEPLDVVHHALLELAAVLLALLQQHAQGRVALVEDRGLAAQRPLRPGQLVGGLAQREPVFMFSRHVAHRADQLVGSPPASVRMTPWSCTIAYEPSPRRSRYSQSKGAPPLTVCPELVAGALVVVGVDAFEPALQAAGEPSGRQPQHLVELLAEVDRTCLDVPVVQHVEGHAQKGAQPGVVVGQRGLGRGAVDPGRGERDAMVAGRELSLVRERQANTRHCLSLPPQKIGPCRNAFCR